MKKVEQEEMARRAQATPGKQKGPHGDGDASGGYSMS